MQIGKSGPLDKGMKRSTFWIKRLKVKARNAVDWFGDLVSK